MLDRKVNRRDGTEKNTICCDSKDCKHPATPQVDHPTAGDAADHARFAGYVTRGEGIVDPMTWHCPNCVQRLKL